MDEEAVTRVKKLVSAYRPLQDGAFQEVLIWFADANRARELREDLLATDRSFQVFLSQSGHLLYLLHRSDVSPGTLKLIYSRTTVRGDKR